MKKIEQKQNTETSADLGEEKAVDKTSSGKKPLYILVVFLFIVVIAIIAGAGYQGWQLFMQYKQQTQSAIQQNQSAIQQNKQQTQSAIQQLQSELEQRPTRTQVDSGISSIRQSVNQTDSRLSSLEQGQQGLVNSTVNLFELYGRDENGWKLAEVEYLMSIAQHKLVLENDFEGAAKTLNAASDRIAELADPGLLQVRVKINEEIAELKTRSRADLVGMTLLLSRLTHQVSSLKPGYQTKTEKAPTATATATATEVVKADPDLPLEQKVMDFMKSLVTVKSTQGKTIKVKPTVMTVIIDVTEQLEDYLKLTRWSVLERDALQYSLLMEQNLKLFKEYYDLEIAANADFYESLLFLHKSQINPQLPDISGSLRLLKQVIKKRENEPKQDIQQETDNG